MAAAARTCLAIELKKLIKLWATPPAVALHLCTWSFCMLHDPAVWQTVDMQWQGHNSIKRRRSCGSSCDNNCRIDSECHRINKDIALLGDQRPAGGFPSCERERERERGENPNICRCSFHKLPDSIVAEGGKTTSRLAQTMAISRRCCSGCCCTPCFRFRTFTRSPAFGLRTTDSWLWHENVTATWCSPQLEAQAHKLQRRERGPKKKAAKMTFGCCTVLFCSVLAAAAVFGPSKVKLFAAVAKGAFWAWP